MCKRLLLIFIKKLSNSGSGYVLQGIMSFVTHKYGQKQLFIFVSTSKPSFFSHFPFGAIHSHTFLSFYSLLSHCLLLSSTSPLYLAIASYCTMISFVSFIVSFLILLLCVDVWIAVTLYVVLCHVCWIIPCHIV